MINSNNLIERILGVYGIICIEDIISILNCNELKSDKKQREFNGKTNLQLFKIVSNVVNPFELNKIKIPMKGLKTPFNKKGYWGFRGNHINTFVEKVI